MSLLFRGRQPQLQQGAQQVKIGALRRLLMGLVHHLQQAVGSLGELARYPFASLMTMAVLGLSLTLPATLYLVVKNTEQVAGNWQQASEITLFLRKDLSQQEVATFTQRLNLSADIEQVEWRDRSAALAEFRERSGYAEAIDALPENPLPDVLIITPAAHKRAASAAQGLLQQLQQEREVAQARLDLNWLQRFNALIDVVRDTLSGLALLLVVAVVLIVGNTIRLNISAKRDEIMVMKLVGATDSYIQRPFLYTGLWYGVWGGLIAWLATAVLMLWLAHTVQEVSGLFDSQVQLRGLQLQEMLVLWLLAIGLGLLGSYLAVRKHVAAIEPQ